MAQGRIRIGIGGWTFPPWRDNLYPKGLAHARELAYAAGKLGAIEINATFHRLQKRESFEKWAAETPDGFLFTVKASRFCSNRRRLDEGGEAIAGFFAQGLTALGPKLGPILWQLANTKKFDAGEIEGFLRLLPREQDGVPLRHAIETNHASFDDPAFVDLARAAGVAIVFGDAPGQAPFREPTADFVYARLRNARADEPAGYSTAEIDAWAETARGWAAARDVHLFMINGAKERAPAAAMAMIERLAG